MPLTVKDLEALNKHKTHNSITHVNYMRKEMLKGKTFEDAHKEAKRKLGK